MSFGKSKQKSVQTSNQSLDPEIKNAILGNYGRAQQVAQTPYRPLTGSMISQYEDPYIQQVIDPTMADLNRSREMTLNDNASRAVAANAFGGSRHGILDAMTNSEFDRNTAGILGSLRSAGYGQALQTAQGENQTSNQWPMLMQQMITQALGLAGNPTLTQSKGVSRGSSYNFDSGLRMNLSPGGGG